MAPGEHAVEIPPSLVPRVVIAELQPAGDGTYRLMARRRELFIPVPEAAKLVRLPYMSLHRLYHGGFIAGDHPTLNGIRISRAKLVRAPGARLPRSGVPDR